MGNTPLKHILAGWNLLCFLSCSLCSHCSNFSINDAISSNLSKLCVHLIAGIHCFGLIWNLSYTLYFLKEHSEGAFSIRATERIQRYFHEYVNCWNVTLRHKTTESASEVGNRAKQCWKLTNYIY